MQPTCLCKIWSSWRKCACVWLCVHSCVKIVESRNKTVTTFSLSGFHWKSDWTVASISDIGLSLRVVTNVADVIYYSSMSSPLPPATEQIYDQRRFSHDLPALSFRHSFLRGFILLNFAVFTTVVVYVLKEIWPLFLCRERSRRDFIRSVVMLACEDLWSNASNHYHLLEVRRG